MSLTRVRVRLTLATTVVTVSTAALLLRAIPVGRLPVACPFYLFTGLLCPGCGATHAFAALLHGNVAEAFHFNQLLVALLPFALAYAATAACRAMRGDTRAWPALPRVTLPLLFVVASAFTVVRNLT